MFSIRWKACSTQANSACFHSNCFPLYYLHIHRTYPSCFQSLLINVYYQTNLVFVKVYFKIADIISTEHKASVPPSFSFEVKRKGFGTMLAWCSLKGAYLNAWARSSLLCFKSSISIPLNGMNTCCTSGCVSNKLRNCIVFVRFIYSKREHKFVATYFLK